MRCFNFRPFLLRTLLVSAVLLAGAFPTRAAETPPHVKPKPVAWYPSYLQACTEAKKSDRLILAYFCSSDADEWTIKLNREVFNTEKFKDFAEKNLILLKCDFLKFKPNGLQKEQNDRLSTKYVVTKVPTLLFLDPDGLLIARCGYDTASLREEEEKGNPASWLKHCARASPSHKIQPLFYPVALKPLALHLARAADRSGLFAGALFRRLLVVPAQLHFAVNAFALQLFLERAQRLIDIVVANHDLHAAVLSIHVIGAGTALAFRRRCLSKYR